MDTPSDLWTPPSYKPLTGWFSILRAWIFRFFDLQAATIWDDMKSELPQVKGVVLDVGCGLQPYRSFLSPEAQYRGLDSINSKLHLGYEAPDTHYYSGTVWPVKSKTIDIILCTETLEHILEPQLFLNEVFRCLRPGGRVLLTIPFAARWHFIPYDYWRYTPSSLGTLLKNAGFNNIKIYARGNIFTVACYKVMAFLFSLIFPGPINTPKTWFSRILGLQTFPLLVATTVAAHLTRRLDGTVDCLGYTVLADRPLLARKNSNRRVQNKACIQGVNATPRL